MRALEHLGRKHLHELARQAVVVGHGDDGERQLGDVGVRRLQPTVARQQRSQRPVHGDDQLRDQLAEGGRGLQRLAQVEAHDMGVEVIGVVAGQHAEHGEHHRRGMMGADLRAGGRDVEHPVQWRQHQHRHPSAFVRPTHGGGGVPIRR